MNNEKMMILNMLQEGKITAEEAGKLLASVEDQSSTDSAKSTHKPSSQVPNSSHSAAPDRPVVAPDRLADGSPVSNDGSRPAGSSVFSGVDFDELGRKFASFAKDLEPKIQKATEIVAEKTVSLADKLSKSLESSSLGSGSGSSGNPGISAPSHGSGTVTGTEKLIELPIAEGYNELSLTGLNADVNIKGYNGDKISARIRYKPNNSSRSAIDLIKLGGKYYLNYEEVDFQFIAIDAYVPSHMFKVINISGANGNMDISGLDCDQLQISNLNGQTVLSNLKANSISSESGNGRLTISGITAATAAIENFNGAIDAGDIDVEKLSLTNSNGSLSMSTTAFDRYDDYLWNVETNNAKLTFNVPTLPDLGYHIKAQAALGNIRIGLTGLEFLVNEPSMVEARTPSYDSRRKKIRLALETSNAPLTVN